MRFKRDNRGFVIETVEYSVTYNEDTKFFNIYREGIRMFRLPVVSGLAVLEQEERLENIRMLSVDEKDSETVKVIFVADSTIWNEREFIWTYCSDHVEFYHTAKGEGALGRCYFFSNGISAINSIGTAQGLEYSADIFVQNYFSPFINHANQNYYEISEPNALGIFRENKRGEYYDPEQMGDGLFCPPPLALIFGGGHIWSGIGIADLPGLYQFNGLEYTGRRFAGSSFYVNYLGYRKADGDFHSPTASIHFGTSEYETLKNHID